MFVSLKTQGGFVQYIYHKPLVPRYDTFKNNLANYSASPCFHDYLCHVWTYQKHHLTLKIANSICATAAQTIRKNASQIF
jgi:hypothetical protein